MKGARFGGALVLAALLVAVVGNSAVGQAKGPVAKDKTTGKQAPAPAAPEVKTFELVNIDPEDFRQTVQAVWDATHPVRPGQPANGLRLATVPRSRTVFVRGTTGELELIAELARVLDIEAVAPIPDSKMVRIVRLRYAKVPEVVPVLNTLGIQGQVIALPRLNAFLLQKDGDSKDARIVIEKIDIEKKPVEKKPIEKLPRKS
jgi:hypothetical protein